MNPTEFQQYYNEAKVAELKAAFDRVKPSPNWKYPIDATIEATIEEIGTIKEAVTFYTGSVAHASIVAHLPGGYKRVQIIAAGYFAAIGA